MFKHSRSINTAVVCLALLAVANTAPASLVDFRATPDISGIHGEHEYAPMPDSTGIRLDWSISQNPDQTWHYEYVFSNQSQGPLAHAVSHIVLQLSETAVPEDFFDFGGDADTVEFNTFGPAPGNPGFPVGESIFGMKIDMGGSQTRFEFNSTRQPMWGDFYLKDGGQPQAFAYNTDLGVEVLNPHDYNGIPVDGTGNPLHKILVPDTFVPEPATLSLMMLGGFALFRRRRR